MKTEEILAPAGNEEALKAAVLSGADAVYLGIGNFNARRNAVNFNAENLKHIIEYCHSRGVKVHITLNTLIKDSEISDAVQTLKTVCQSGADAVIIQDLGVARLVRTICPDIEMHASTQMSVGTLSGLEILKKMGFKRAVLPRELSLDEIKDICKKSPLDLEVFIHGALCMCVSGQCLMSAFLGSRSGNRGLCAQPCRLPFKAQNGTGHDLSLKDLSIIKNIPALSALGVKSFKIEGRMKRPEYVCATVKACKDAIDGNLSAETKNDLQSLFSRSGFTDGYYQGKLGKDMFGFREKENVQSATKDLLSKYSAMYNKEIPRFPIEFRFLGEIGKNAVLYAKCKDFEVRVESEIICEKPINRPVSADRIRESLLKCGGTQFAPDKVTIEGEIDYSLPVSAVNSMRRDALSLLEAEISKTESLKPHPAPPSTNIKSQNGRNIYCRFDSIEQIPENADISKIFVPLDTDDEIVKSNGYGIELPHGMFGNEEKVEKILRNSSAKFALCHTLDCVAIAKKYGKEVVASHSLNILNSYAMDEAKSLGINEAVISCECTLERFADISAPIKKGLTVYGRISLMLTRNCPIKNGKTCAQCGRKSEITDRKGISFPVRCSFGYSEILNSRPIYMADRLKEIPSADFLFFNFTVETKSQAAEILNAYKNEESPQGEFTRGLLYRGTI